MTDEPAFVVLMRVHLHFPESGSLKAKRAELNRVKAHLRQRMGASVAEVGHLDTWQRSTLAVAFAEALARRAATRPPTGCSGCSTRASRRACARSGGSCPGTTWEQ